VLPRRHVRSVFDLAEPELAGFFALVGKVRAQLQAELQPDAFTIGINDGAAAGQTVEHAHCHLIPRCREDAADPRGGIRLLFPDRALR
jgi:diadenosine tetraphosphate (Ap4A) HIT family hydrolase